MKSLKNEQIYAEKVESTQNSTTEETQNIYNINDWTDSEESYTEQRARIKAEEEARWRKCYPAIEPFERTQAPLNANGQLLTAQAAWEMVCDQLKKRFGSTTYRLLLGDAVLVDFNPKNETFIVIVRHLRNSNTFYQGHYQTIQQVLADVYGSMKVNIRLLTRVDWANYKKSIIA